MVTDYDVWVVLILTVLYCLAAIAPCSLYYHITNGIASHATVENATP
jgi:hypothetical protein